MFFFDCNWMYMADGYERGILDAVDEIVGLEQADGVARIPLHRTTCKLISPGV